MENELKPNAQTKFIFVTGHGAVSKSDEDLIEKDLYLSKPLDIEILIKRIKELVKEIGWPSITPLPLY